MELLSSKQLCEQLGLPLETIRSFRRQGMPSTLRGRHHFYDPGEVSTWLVEHGYATVDTTQQQPSGPVVSTAAECARAMGVHIRTVREWHYHPTFPGVPNQLYPIDAIEKWHREDVQPNSNQFSKWGTGKSESSTRDRKDLADAELRELELAEKRRELVRVDDVEREVEQAHNYALAQLEPLPGQYGTFLPVGSFGFESLMANIESILPEKIDDIKTWPALRNQIMSQVGNTVQLAIDSIQVINEQAKQSAKDAIDRACSAMCVLFENGLNDETSRDGDTGDQPEV